MVSENLGRVTYCFRHRQWKKESCLKFHTSNNAYTVKYSFMKITTYRVTQAQAQYMHNCTLQYNQNLIVKYDKDLQLDWEQNCCMQ